MSDVDDDSIYINPRTSNGNPRSNGVLHIHADPSKPVGISGNLTVGKSDEMNRFDKILSSLSEMIKEKNRRYGNSALEPLGIFSKHVKEENSEAYNGLLIRLDDKLKRIKNSDKIRKNDIADLMGYLTLLCEEKGWNDFSELID